MQQPQTMQSSQQSQLSGQVALFACTLCNSRHPFEELSQGQQLCKDCRGAFQIVKCTYCRTEFQQESKSNMNIICKKCEQNVKLYGKPSACEYCNIIAAFIGNKCQRCTNSEKKYGPALPCEQCKQRCAFDRKDPESRKKVDGKLLCWLCTLSYKRALAKAKQNDTSIRHTSISVHKSSRSSSSRHRHRHHHHNQGNSNSSSTLGTNCGVILPLLSSSSSTASTSGTLPSSSSSSSKRPRIDAGISSKTSNGGLSLPTVTANVVNEAAILDPSSSDHVVAVTQLKEKMANLQKQLQKKDQELLDKDKKIAELRSQMMRDEKDWREKLQTSQKNNNEKINQLHSKISQLQKQFASSQKGSKKVRDTGSASIFDAVTVAAMNTNSNGSNGNTNTNSNNGNAGNSTTTPNDSPII